MGVQKFRWDKDSSVRAGDYDFSMEEETAIINYEKDLRTLVNSISS